MNKKNMFFETDFELLNWKIWKEIESTKFVKADEEVQTDSTKIFATDCDNIEHTPQHPWKDRSKASQIA